jgi:hypothetical protein
MRIKLSKSDWRLVGQKMGWLKKAQWIVQFSKEEFLAKTLAEKKVIAKEQPITIKLAKLFFTEKYEGKGKVLRALASNTFLHDTAIVMDFYSYDYDGKAGTIDVLHSFLKDSLKKKPNVKIKE